VVRGTCSVACDVAVNEVGGGWGTAGLGAGQGVLGDVSCFPDRCWSCCGEQGLVVAFLVRFDAFGAIFDDGGIPSSTPSVCTAVERRFGL